MYIELFTSSFIFTYLLNLLTYMYTNDMWVLCSRSAACRNAVILLQAACLAPLKQAMEAGQLSFAMYVHIYIYLSIHLSS